MSKLVKKKQRYYSGKWDMYVWQQSLDAEDEYICTVDTLQEALERVKSAIQSEYEIGKGLAIPEDECPNISGYRVDVEHPSEQQHNFELYRIPERTNAPLIKLEYANGTQGERHVFALPAGTHGTYTESPNCPPFSKINNMANYPYTGCVGATATFSSPSSQKKKRIPSNIIRECSGECLMSIAEVQVERIADALTDNKHEDAKVELKHKSLADGRCYVHIKWDDNSRTLCGVKMVKLQGSNSRVYCRLYVDDNPKNTIGKFNELFSDFRLALMDTVEKTMKIV